VSAPAIEPDAAAAPRATWTWETSAWAGLGLAGSVLAALAAPHALHDGVVGWWYHPAWPGRAATALIWIGMAALAVAWLGLGRRLPSRGPLLAIAAAWIVPLALAPPLFSRDLYSYYAQGTLLHLGVSPYHHPPAVLAGLHHGHVLAAVSPFWRHTTAPYGPLFLAIVALIAGVAGSHLIAGVLLTRGLALVGIGLFATAAPGLARALGSDERRMLWLIVAGPLTTLGLVAAGHNDALMAGLLAAGVVLALDGRPLHGIGVCALAATVKVPALAAVAFIAVAWARAEGDRDRAVRLLAGALAVTVLVLALVTAVTGAGVAWLSTSLFSTPAKVRLAITPGTATGYTVAAVAKLVGVSVHARGVEAAFGAIGSAAGALAGLELLRRARVGRVVALLGIALLIAAAAGPAAWPWYGVWGLVLVAALPGAQRSLALAAAVVAGAFAVKPNGVLALPLGTAPAVLAAYVALAAVARWRWRRRADSAAADPAGSRSDNAASSALART
jgi:alpha-1,6-mannosyltransferase